ncbi:MAG TPA: 50S ribosomal protein L16 [Candidatus Aenigmarchaeota archaeon]|nr:MAG: 50S ribosomal protein L16 [Candidatus Aenigmarchaeota archaeon]HDD46111.1 50S ribosomal protein L16 [Candidatus Aenigmarchaeota archaeon]
MGLRPAKCYRKLERPYTRQSKSKPRKSYVKGVPYPKIHRFEIGAKDKKFGIKMFLLSKKPVQIRHNALEAARMAVTKQLSKLVGENNYFVKILVYPHHVLRENPLATGAGADRFQTGMRKSFGRPIGMAARVRSNQKLIEIRVPENFEAMGKRALKVAASKFPTPCHIVSEKLEN